MRFAILGSVTVVGPRGAVAVTAPRELALLAELLVHAGRPVTREHLADRIWGEQEVRHPAHAVHHPGLPAAPAAASGPAAAATPSAQLDELPPAGPAAPPSGRLRQALVELQGSTARLEERVRDLEIALAAIGSSDHRPPARD